MDRSTPGFPVLHYLLEFAQTHIHQVNDAIQPAHPLSSPSPPALNLSQQQDLFQWVGSSHRVSKVLELQHHSFQWIFTVDLLLDGLVGSPCCPRDSQWTIKYTSRDVWKKEEKTKARIDGRAAQCSWAHKRSRKWPKGRSVLLWLLGFCLSLMRGRVRVNKVQCPGKDGWHGWEGREPSLSIWCSTFSFLYLDTSWQGLCGALSDHGKYNIRLKETVGKWSESRSVVSDSWGPHGLYVAPQASLSMGFSRQEYWSGQPFPSPGDLANPGMEPRSPTLQVDSLPSEPPGKPTGAREPVFLMMIHHLQIQGIPLVWVTVNQYLILDSLVFP